MKIALHPLIDERERCLIPISEFSFAAYPVQINHVLRSLPDMANSPNKSRNLWSRRFSLWLRWACGKPATAPAAGNISLEQAVP
jgi:hypothetical protein